MRIDDYAIQKNLKSYGVFAATERLLMAAVNAGGNRQEFHEVIREHSLAAWEAMRTGQANPLADRLCADTRITQLIPTEQAHELLNAETYVGDAPARARQMAHIVRSVVESESEELAHAHA